MSLIVETGVIGGVAGAESYVSVADADTYWTNRGNDAWSGLDTASKEAALRNAAQYLDTTYDWIGQRVKVNQSLCWPRWIEDGMDRDNRLVMSTDIPTKLKEAQCELALEYATNGVFDPTLERQTKQETVGPLTVVYADSAAGQRTFPKIDKLVRDLTCGGYGSIGSRSVRS